MTLTGLSLRFLPVPRLELSRLWGEAVLYHHGGPDHCPMTLFQQCGDSQRLGMGTLVGVCICRHPYMCAHACAAQMDSNKQATLPRECFYSAHWSSMRRL